MFNFKRVFDRKENAIRGLWQKLEGQDKGAYYTQMRVDGKPYPIRVKIQFQGKDLPTTPAQALEQLAMMKSQRRDGDLHVQYRRGVPTFTEVADRYLEALKTSKAKSANSIKREASSIAALKGYFGQRPINQIENHETLAPSGGYVLWRKQHRRRKSDKIDGVSGRAIDVDIVVLRQVLQTEVGKHLRSNPIIKFERKRLADAPKEVRLFTTEEVDAIIETARQLTAQSRQRRNILREMLAMADEFQDGRYRDGRKRVSWEKALAAHPEWKEKLRYDDPKARQAAYAAFTQLRTGESPTADNDEQFADYLIILKNTGAREQEALRLRWSLNVEWKKKLLGFGQDGLSKGGKKQQKARWVPWVSKELDETLHRMYQKRDPNCDFLFPSPRPGALDGELKPVTSFKKSLTAVKEALQAKRVLTWMNQDVFFHYFRHYFISVCCMSSVDLLTCAKWVGHTDMKMISKIYAHLNEEHSREQAAKVNFNTAREMPTPARDGLPKSS